VEWQMRGRILKDEFGHGEHAARLLREATADHVCDIAIAGAQDDFRFRSAMIPLDGAMLIGSNFGSYSNERTPRHIARGGMDHYMVTLCLNGALTFGAGTRSVMVRPGDLCLQDMVQASRTQLAADQATALVRVLTLVLPRPMLAPLMASPDGSTASLISRDSIQGRLLAGQFLALYGGAAGNGSGAPVVSSDALAGVIADTIGSRRSAELKIDRANRHLLLASIKRAIARNLLGDVSVDRLCRQFQISRATLYRLFEPEGGLWRHIQDQRLNRAFQQLASPAAGLIRMIDLAVEIRIRQRHHLRARLPPAFRADAGRDQASVGSGPAGLAGERLGNARLAEKFRSPSRVAHDARNAGIATMKQVHRR
jgi:AraC-like DNA-binding protein